MLNKILIVLLLAASWNMSATEEIPLVNMTLNSKEVKNFQNTSLQLNLRAQLMANSTWRRLIEQKRMSVSLVDLNDPDNIKYASINGTTYRVSL